MKFICDNCKAKYQIGDEKVAGKMVRMKCRRCGHLVQVSASVTESSVAQALPTEPPRVAGEDSHRVSHSDDDPTAVFSASGEGSVASLVEAMMKVPGTPGPAMPAVVGPQAQPPGPPPRPGGAPRPPVAPRPPPAAAAVRPVGLPRPVGPPSESREAGQPQPQPPDRPAPAAPVVRALAPSAPAIRALAPSAPAIRAPEPSAPVIRAPVPAPAPVTAFKPPVPQERLATKTPVVRATPSEDWYVGVSGVPLGPVRLSVIRDKALAGAVDGESLVWREGFEEWQPLKSFPELLEIVTQAQATRLTSPGRRGGATLSGGPISGPVSLAHPGRSLTPASVVVPVAAPPVVAPAVAAPPVVAPAVPSSPIAAAARPPPRAPAPPEAGAAAPIMFAAAAGGAVRAGSEGNAPLDLLADPFAATRPVAAGAAVRPAPGATEAAGAMMLLPGAAPASASAQVPGTSPPLAPVPARHAAEPAPLLATPASLVETVSPRRRSGMSPLAYAFIAMAAAFGGVSAFVLLSPKPQPVQPVTTAQVPAPPVAGAAFPPPPSVAEPDPAPPAESASARADLPPPTKAGGAPPPKTTSDPKPGASAGSSTLDMSGFSGAGVAGPRSGPGSTSQSAALGQLSQGDISAVVERSRASVRRSCWQPALEARATNASTNARVTASVVIAASGAVQSVTAAGSEKDYPGLSSCIAERIRAWKFPASSGSTPVSIPFVFAAQ